MAGHSKFKNIMHRKGAQDKKRAKVFSKLLRGVVVAAKNGGDLQFNPALRVAVANAKAANMPKDNIDRAIKKATSDDATNYQEMRYEGYGPAGTALIVEVLTDNKNRSAGEIRSAFSKYGGSLGETNSVAYMFKRVAVMYYEHNDAKPIDAEQMLDYAIDAGASDVISSEEGHEVICETEDFHTVSQALTDQLGDATRSELTWRPENEIMVDKKDKAKTLIKLLDVLDDNDDVVQVSGNYVIPDEIIEELDAQ